MEPEPVVAAAADAVRSRSARWTFTVNNPCDWRPLWRPGPMAYLVWQLERGAEGQTPHIQGYVRFAARKDLRAAKNCINCVHAHMEVARGTEEQNREYCTKEETRLEAGEEHGEFQADQGKQGRRSDLEAIADKIKKGVTLKEIAKDHPSDYIRYHTGLAVYAEMVGPSPALARPLEILVLWGPSATGKTHRAMHLMPDAYVVVGCGRDPFGRYTGEKDLLLDEFQAEDWKLPVLLRILDKWKMPLDCRYRDRYAEWTRVIICSNRDPETWCANRLLFTEAQQLALHRRVNGCCRRVSSRDSEISSLPNEPRWAELETGYLPTSLVGSGGDVPIYDLAD